MHEESTYRVEPRTQAQALGTTSVRALPKGCGAWGGRCDGVLAGEVSFRASPMYIYVVRIMVPEERALERVQGLSIGVFRFSSVVQCARVLRLSPSQPHRERGT